MNDYIFFDDIPEGERRNIRRRLYKEVRSLNWMGGALTGFSVFVATCIAKGMFPEKSDSTGKLLVSIFLAAGFAFILHKAITEPKIVRLTERIKNKK